MGLVTGLFGGGSTKAPKPPAIPALPPDPIPATIANAGGQSKQKQGIAGFAGTVMNEGGAPGLQTKNTAKKSLLG